MITTRRTLLAMFVTVAVAAGCTSHEKINSEGTGRRILEEKLLAAAPGGPLQPLDEVVPGFGLDGPDVLIRSDKGWFTETIDGEPGFVTDVVRVGDAVVAVGATGARRLGATVDELGELRPVIWIRSAAGGWARAFLPPTEHGWLTGVAKTDMAVVAVGRTIGSDGDAYALSADHNMQAWTSASLGSGAGLQLVSSVAANATSFVAFGVVEGADPPPFATALWTSLDGRGWTAAPHQEKGNRASDLSVLRADGSVLSIGGANTRNSFPQALLARYSSASEPATYVDLGELDAIGVRASASVVAAVAVPRLRTVNDKVWFFPTLDQANATHVELPIKAKDVDELRLVRGSVLESSRNVHFAVQIDRKVRVYQIEEI
jgi:hypothetical protein